MGPSTSGSPRAEPRRAASGRRGAATRAGPARARGGNPEHGRTATALVRQVRPRVVAIPYGVDRHPDHVAANQVLTEAVFNSGLRRYDDGTGTPAWRPEWVCYYFINDSAPPSFVVDVSEYHDHKRRALACHVSQFKVASESGVTTRLTSPLFQQLVESRDAQFGALAGVTWAEGVVVREPVVRPHL